MKIIGSYCMSNTASLNIYRVRDDGEVVLAGINDTDPEWCPIVSKNEVEDEDIRWKLYVRFGKLDIPMDEIMIIHK